MEITIGRVLLVALLLVVVWGLYKYLSYRYHYAKRIRVRGATPTFPLGNLSSFNPSVLKGMEYLFRDNADRETGLASMWLMGEQQFSVLRAEDAELLLKISTYRKPNSFTPHVKQMLGFRSLVSLMGTEWKVHRKLMMKTFSSFHLKQMVEDHLPGPTTYLLNHLANLAKSPDATDLEQTLKNTTLDVIGLAAFGFSFGCSKTLYEGGSTSPVALAFQYLLDDMTQRQYTLNPLLSFYWLPIQRNRKFRQERKVISDTIREIINSKKASRGTSDREDLLEHMINAQDKESGSRWTEEDLIDNVLTLMFGGFDTTSTALGFALLLLSENPRVEQKLHEEVDAILNGGLPTYEQSQQLKYTEAVFEEVLRLYPPAPINTRTLTEDLELHNIHFKAGTMFWIPTFLIQTEEMNWGADAKQFRPERHLEQNSFENSAFSPFSLGHRNCVGMRFAMREGPALLAILCHFFRFRTREGYEMKTEYSGVIQKLVNGVPVHIEQRRPVPTL